MDSELDSRDYVNSLARGLEVIRAFSRHKPRLTMSEVASLTDQTRASARRSLLTLVSEGYVETDGKLFWLRPKVLELGYSALSSMSFLEVMQPMMADVADKLNESCSAAVLDQADIVYVARSASRRVVNITSTIGGRIPAYCTAAGRVLLGGLSDGDLTALLDRISPNKLTQYTMTSKVKLREAISQAKRQGWCLVDQELEIGLCSISVPVCYRSGAIAAALAIGAPTGRAGAALMAEKYLPVLLAAAHRLSLIMPE